MVKCFVSSLSRLAETAEGSRSLLAALMDISLRVMGNGDGWMVVGRLLREQGWRRRWRRFLAAAKRALVSLRDAAEVWGVEM